MRNRRRVLVLLAVTAAAVAAVGSGSFTATTADRGVSVDVVGDENAYLALDYPDKEVDNGSTPTFLTVTNRFTTTLDDITVEYWVGESVDNLASRDDGTLQNESVGVGEARSFGDVTLTCPNNSTGTETATVYFDVTAYGDGIDVETTKDRTVELTVNCSAS